jgi:hypothetical protein
MAWTSADLEKLNAAISSGAAVGSIAFADQTYTFRSMDELLKLRAQMIQEVTPANRFRLAATSKGV